jgi:F420-0:gamma-glutamyl ligase
MKRLVGTTIRGIRTPIINEGDDLLEMLPELLANAAQAEGFTPRNRDVLCITESVFARAQGNYAHVNDIANSLRQHFPQEPSTIAIVHPILSRNRFALLLRGIAIAAKKLIIELSYPTDEVGNQIIDKTELWNANVNPYTDVFDEERFSQIFTKYYHEFTGINYVDLYRDICEKEDCEVQFVFANNPRAIIGMAENIIVCDIHTRHKTLQMLQEAGAKNVIGLDQILNEPGQSHGYNREYGLLGSNKATEDKVKLFPRDSQPFVEALQLKLKERFGKDIEVMIYGDGAFKDPHGGIWELADPVVSPGFTSGLQGRPNELKIKYLADNDYAGLSSSELTSKIQKRVRDKFKSESQKSARSSEGTTPRQITDLLGSLADLASGSGDKGTPIVYIQGYFDSYADEYED